MERKITKQKYPYGLQDFVSNVKEYGFQEAWEHDKARTRENLEDRTFRLGEEILFGLVVTVAIPYVIYGAVKESEKKNIG